jgi:hypothetical protein
MNIIYLVFSRWCMKLKSNQISSAHFFKVQSDHMYKVDHQVFPNVKVLSETHL